MLWSHLKFWQSGEWQAIEERLNDLEKRGVVFNPARNLLFAALDSTPFESVRVAIFGQDPYPDPKYATGLAFSIPSSEKTFPPTLQNIFKEYTSDLHYPTPQNGSLNGWVNQGVLLWNVIPTCEMFRSLSHRDWTEWQWLTKEIVETLAKKDIVMIFLGGVAREFVKFVGPDDGEVIELSHPSPRASATSNNPFLGSRIFSTINQKLCEQKLEPIQWRLP